MRTNKRIYLTTLDVSGHNKTAGYWYLIAVAATSHTAFKTRFGLLRYLDERGLKLSEELPEHGKHSSQSIVGEYGEQMHMSVAEFEALTPVLETRTLSNGDYVVAKITEENGIRVVHTLNPNVHERKVFDYRESDAMMK